MGHFWIIGELTDSDKSSPFRYLIEIINQAPDFVVAPVNQVAYLGNVTQYVLPEVVDKEGLKATLRVTKPDGSKLPSFIKFENGVLTFDIPKDEALLGTKHAIMFTMDDAFSKPN